MYFTYLGNNLQSNLQFRSAGREKDDSPLCEKFQAKSSTILYIDYPAI